MNGDCVTLIAAPVRNGMIVIPGQREMDCARCGCRVAVAPSGLERLATARRSRLWCVPCAIEVAPDEPVEPMSRAQAAEALSALHSHQPTG